MHNRKATLIVEVKIFTVHLWGALGGGVESEFDTSIVALGKNGVFTPKKSFPAPNYYANYLIE